MILVYIYIYIYIIYIYIYIYKVDKDCQYRKKEYSMHAYLTQNIPAKQNIYFCLKNKSLEIVFL